MGFCTVFRSAQSTTPHFVPIADVNNESRDSARSAQNNLWKGPQSRCKYLPQRRPVSDAFPSKSLRFPKNRKKLENPPTLPKTAFFWRVLAGFGGFLPRIMVDSMRQDALNDDSFQVFWRVLVCIFSDLGCGFDEYVLKGIGLAHRTDGKQLTNMN